VRERRREGRSDGRRGRNVGLEGDREGETKGRKKKEIEKRKKERKERKKERRKGGGDGRPWSAVCGAGSGWRWPEAGNTSPSNLWGASLVENEDLEFLKHGFGE